MNMESGRMIENPWVAPSNMIILAVGALLIALLIVNLHFRKLD